MSFVVAAADSGYPTQGYSQPDRVSFSVQDDGGGGNILVNGLGVTSGSVVNAIDLQTFFGTAFRSIPILRAFRASPSLVDSFNLLNEILEYYAVALTDPNLGMPSFNVVYGVGGGPATAPYLSVGGPAVAGQWRIELRLRHSITN